MKNTLPNVAIRIEIFCCALLLQMRATAKCNALDAVLPRDTAQKPGPPFPETISTEHAYRSQQARAILHEPRLDLGRRSVDLPPVAYTQDKRSDQR